MSQSVLATHFNSDFSCYSCRPAAYYSELCCHCPRPHDVSLVERPVWGGRCWWWRFLKSLLMARPKWSCILVVQIHCRTGGELPVEVLCNRLRAGPGWSGFFHQKRLRILGGPSGEFDLLPPSLRSAAVGTTGPVAFGMIPFPAGNSTGLELPAGCAAGCSASPDLAAWWQGREDHKCAADLSLRWGVAQLWGEGRYNPWHNHIHRGCGVFRHCRGSDWRLFPQQTEQSRRFLRCIPQAPGWPCGSSWRNVLPSVRAGRNWRGR